MVANFRKNVSQVAFYLMIMFAAASATAHSFIGKDFVAKSRFIKQALRRLNISIYLKRYATSPSSASIYVDDLLKRSQSHFNDCCVIRQKLGRNINES